MDEADHLTKDAQNALRRIVEDFTEITRFVLVCNYITKIIEPLNSRCMKFRFNQISKKTQIKRLRGICKSEKLLFQSEVLECVVEISLGDLRKALNLLQMASSTKKEGTKITKEDVLFISDVIPCENAFNEYIIPYINIEKSSNKHKEKNKMEFIDQMISQGVTAQQFISAIHKQVLEKSNIKALKKARLIVALTEAEESVLVGVDDFTVLSLLFAQIENVIE